MIATPAAIESRPVRTLAWRTRLSMPVVSAMPSPSRMKRAPMKVARLRTLQSMLRDENSGDDQQQAVEQQQRPVAGDALGGLTRELMSKVGDCARCNEHVCPPRVVGVTG
jgi:hypothetical protein